jgi:hypothetical protein
MPEWLLMIAYAVALLAPPIATSIMPIGRLLPWLALLAFLFWRAAANVGPNSGSMDGRSILILAGMLNAAGLLVRLLGLAIDLIRRSEAGYFGDRR